MKVLGIVSEYNPFHNGHRYHIEKSKAITGCDAVVCVMSGNFIQRGEPAIINKFARTEMALQNGVDLVIELPVPFAMSSAEFFGFGAIKILDSIGIVDCISFGSEHGDVAALQQISNILADEPLEYKDELKRQLSSGISFPTCRQIAIQKYLDSHSHSTNSTDLSSILETSNNILGIEYLKAIKRLKSQIKAYTIERISNQYNSVNLTGAISSATAIRNNIQKKYEAGGLSENSLLSDTSESIPAQTGAILENELFQGRGPNSIYSFENIIFALLRQMKIEQICQIPDVTEGLEYRIKKAADDSSNIDQLLANICTKRYTRTRIQRILLSLLTGVTKTDMDIFMQYGGPQYARILGFNSVGRELLHKMKKNSTLPTITKISNYKASCNRLLTRMLEIESKSTDIYVLGYKNPTFKKAGQEFTNKIKILK